ncbi:hypothetical protein LINPERHAP1_LOCUS15557 [Linum perenne]
MELHERPDAKSRGELPLLFLENTMVYVTNRPKGSEEEEAFIVHDVSPGLHVVSNANLDSPDWPKVQKLGLGFKEQLLNYGEGEIPLKEIGKKLMRDRAKAEKNRLPGICSVDWEFGLSSIFVEVDTPLLGRCGTRSTIALAITRNGEVSFDETYLEDGTWKEKTISYRIQNTHKIKQLNK